MLARQPVGRFASRLCRAFDGTPAEAGRLGSLGRLACGSCRLPAALDHGPALIRTPPTSGSACLAVLGLVPLAFVGASVTDPRAKGAEFDCELTPASHQRCCHAANCGAVDVHANALRHLRYLVFSEACAGTMITRRRACLARANTGNSGFMSHGNLLDAGSPGSMQRPNHGACSDRRSHTAQPRCAHIGRASERAIKPEIDASWSSSRPAQHIESARKATT